MAQDKGTMFRLVFGSSSFGLGAHRQESESNKLPKRKVEGVHNQKNQVSYLRDSAVLRQRSRERVLLEVCVGVGLGDLG